MAYQKNYTIQDQYAFWQKDLLTAKESAMKAVSTINEGSAMKTEDAIKEAEKIMQWFYPDGTEFKDPNIIKIKKEETPF